MSVDQAIESHRNGVPLQDILDASGSLQDRVRIALLREDALGHPNPRFSPSLVQEMLDEYSAGVPARTLARRHGVLLSTVLRMLASAAGPSWEGIRTQRVPMAEETIIRIPEPVGSAPLSAFAKILGITYKRARFLLDSSGIKPIRVGNKDLWSLDLALPLLRAQTSPVKDVQ